MNQQARITYYGWSSLSIHAPNSILIFDPFFRKYCGAQWFNTDDIPDPDVVCVTHGHEEHYLDVPEIVKKSGATVVATKTICNYLKVRNKVAEHQLNPIPHYKPIDVKDFHITAFPWKHRDVNVFASVLQAVFKGNSTKLAWAWSSFINAPFWGSYTGFHVELPSGLKILNYNEGFNTKMTNEDIESLGKKIRTDVLLAGMQMHYTDDVARGAAALQPKTVLLYPPHEHFHKMMEATMAPWEDFAVAVKDRLPGSKVVIAYPGTTIDAATGDLLDPVKPTVVSS